MNYREINLKAIHCFPELQESFESQFVFWGNKNPPQHCFLGNVFNKLLSKLLLDEKDVKTINKIFAFYEEMAKCCDEEVRNLLQVTLLEYLWDEKIIFQRAEKYMLPETKKINDLIGEYLNKPE